MSGCGKTSADEGGLDALLEAAKFIEEQEKQKLRRQSLIKLCEESVKSKEVLPQLVCFNSAPTLTPASSNNPTPLLPRHGFVIREVHKKLEKDRRAHLKDCFETLKKLLPPIPVERKTSNLGILHNAIRYISVLQRKERESEHLMEILAREKIAHQQRLSTLKKEITAQWEHIDLNTLLPEEVEPKPRRISDLLNGRMADTGSDEDVVRSSPLYSSTSSLSSASPLHSDSVSQHTLVVSSPGPPSLIVSPIQQLLPSTAIHMLRADTHLIPSTDSVAYGLLLSLSQDLMDDDHLVTGDPMFSSCHHLAPLPPLRHTCRTSRTLTAWTSGCLDSQKSRVT